MTGRDGTTLIGVNAGITLAQIGSYIYLPILIPILGADFGGFWAGFVIFLTYVGRLLSTFFYEGLIARFANRNTVIAGVLVEAVAIGLMGFASGIPIFSVLAFFVGFGSGMSFPGLKNILGKFPEQDRPKAFSSFQMAYQLGLLGGAMLGGLFVGVDLRVLFSVVFALFLGYCLVAFSLIPADPAERIPRTGTPLFSIAVLRGLRIGGGTRYFLLSSVYWMLAATFFVSMPLHMAAYVPHWSPSVPFWIAGLTLLILQYPLFGFMNRRFAPALLMAIGFGAICVADLLFGAGRTALWVVIGAIVVVLGDILFTPSFDVWVSGKMAAERLAKAMGAMHFFRSFGNMVGSLTAGLLFEVALRAGIPGLNWYVAGAVALACALFCAAGTTKNIAARRRPSKRFATAAVRASDRSITTGIQRSRPARRM
ncbi:MFS transporter [Nocardia sp. NPDC127526]|uniref:MFS transporter n=1 Tax=Nocardia sp. NPDC127526 TaxID=3345393 RepID=UPI00362DD611